MSFNNYLLMDEEKFKKEEENIFKEFASNREEFVIWAKDNNKFYDTNIYTSEKIFSVATKYLINDNYGNYNDDDIKYLIYYFSKKLFNDLDIRGVKTDISYGKFYTDYASSYYNYEDGIITFFMDSFKCLKGNNPDLLNGLMLIYHDIYRVSQENAIRNKKNNFDFIDYVIAMETINVYNTNGFYYNNYDRLIRENMAGIYSFIEVSHYLTENIPGIKELSYKDMLDSIIDEYNESLDDKSLMMYGIVGDRFKQLDLGSRKILSIDPSMIVKYPIMLFGFDIEGNKKGTEVLLEDYNKLIKLNKDKKNQIDNFYSALITERYYLDNDKDSLDSDIRLIKSFLKDSDGNEYFYNGVLDILNERNSYIKNSKKNLTRNKKSSC